MTFVDDYDDTEDRFDLPNMSSRIDMDGVLDTFAYDDDDDFPSDDSPPGYDPDQGREDEWMFR